MKLLPNSVEPGAPTTRMTVVRSLEEFVEATTEEEQRVTAGNTK
jgi:hypothetical protein